MRLQQMMPTQNAATLNFGSKGTKFFFFTFPRKLLFDSKLFTGSQYFCRRVLNRLRIYVFAAPFCIDWKFIVLITFLPHDCCNCTFLPHTTSRIYLLQFNFLLHFVIFFLPHKVTLFGNLQFLPNAITLFVNLRICRTLLLVRKLFSH